MIWFNKTKQKQAISKQKLLYYNVYWQLTLSNLSGEYLHNVTICINKDNKNNKRLL